MLYSSASKYAVRALAYMATEEDQETFTVEQIARGANVPKPYLSKVLKQLVSGKILKSNKGPGGGYRFAKDVHDISLYDIKIAIDGMTEFVECSLGLDSCNDAAPCPAHFIWKELRAAATKSMQVTTLYAAGKIITEKMNHPEASKKVMYRRSKDS